MNPQDAQNMAQWLQTILKETQDMRNELAAVHSVIKQATDEIKATSASANQKDADTLRLIDNLRAQIDIVKGDVAATKNSTESHNGHIESLIKDLKSDIHEVRNRVT